MSEVAATVGCATLRSMHHARASFHSGKASHSICNPEVLMLDQQSLYTGQRTTTVHRTTPATPSSGGCISNLPPCFWASMRESTACGCLHCIVLQWASHGCRQSVRSALPACLSLIHFKRPLLPGLSWQRYWMAHQERIPSSRPWATLSTCVPSST